MKKQDSNYNNESITSLKGAERVRLRPGVIFGSDGLDGCEHAFFEILSNSIDEAREGYGKKIEITRFKDDSILVRDHGRGIPVDYNPKEDCFNWELVFCELYAGDPTLPPIPAIGFMISPNFFIIRTSLSKSSSSEPTLPDRPSQTRQPGG